MLFHSVILARGLRMTMPIWSIYLAMQFTNKMHHGGKNTKKTGLKGRKKHINLCLGEKPLGLFVGIKIWQR